nr:MAG TPA: hypothetical protein [Caudoviricetes sp.]
MVVAQSAITTRDFLLFTFSNKRCISEYKTTKEPI